jgi:inner membrane protein
VISVLPRRDVRGVLMLPRTHFAWTAPVQCGRDFIVDPVTHALAGAAAARVAVGRPLGNAAWLPGAVAALLPDADALIRNSADPLLYAEFHRHFTHALAFIPLGGAIATLPWMLQAKRRTQWKAYLAAATVGYGTHGILDAATTWGTRLLWPFSEARVAWNWISIVDPVFTVIVLTGVIVALRRRSAGPAAVVLAMGAVYLGAGAVQESRARDVQAHVAAARGHVVERGVVLPGFGNQVVWRSIYEAGGTLYMDRVRVPWWNAPTWSPGYEASPVREDDLPAEVTSDLRLRKDFHRFATFAGGWLARGATETDLIGDARYSSADDRFEPVWSIRFQPRMPVPIEWVDRSGQRRVDPAALWREVIGRDPGHRPIP